MPPLPPALSVSLPVSIYTPGWTQERNTMSPVRAQTLPAQSRDEHTNPDATTPPLSFLGNLLYLLASFDVKEAFVALTFLF